MNRKVLSLFAGFLASGLLAAAVQAQEAYYSYVHTLDGDATLVEGDTGERAEATINLPILPGDRLDTHRGTRLGVLLADGDRLAVDEDTMLEFVRLARTPESSDQSTSLRLERGRLHLVHGLSTQVPTEIDTGNSRIYADGASEIMVSASGDSWTQIVVREGYVEVVDRRGSSVVRAGEELHIEGSRNATSRLVSAGSLSGFEIWAAGQDITLTSSEYVEEPLPGRVSNLDQHGDWVAVEKGRAWRPAVAAEWQPYRRGYWRSTPSGMYWVSLDPWASSVWHYGSWDLHPRFGWLWYPGYRFAPAHVYWYWGDSYTAWVPWGYYHGFYRRAYNPWGFYHGIYGWAGGRWSHFDNWVFCPPGRLGYRDQYRHHRRGRHYRDERGPHGIVTTDTRGIDIRQARDRRGQDVLRDRWSRDGNRGRAELPDVTSFVRRDRELTDEVQNRVLVAERPNRDSRDGTRVIGAPAVTPRGGSRVVRTAPGQRPTIAGPGTGSRSRAEGTGTDRGATSRNRGQVDRETAGRSAAERGERSPARRVIDPIRDRSQRSGARSTERPSTRRPSTSRPTTRPTTPRPTTPRVATPSRPRTTTRPPSARPQTTTRRPTSTRPPTARPTSPRPSPRSSSQARPRTSRPPASRSSARPPSARPTTRSNSRPAARPSPSTGSRTRAPSRARSTSRPPQAARPAARPSATSRPPASRPAARSSASRPAARPSTTRSSPRPAASRPASRPASRSRASSPPRSSTRSSARPAPSRSSSGSRASSSRAQSSSRPAARSRSGSSSRSSGSSSRSARPRRPPAG